MVATLRSHSYSGLEPGLPLTRYPASLRGLLESVVPFALTPGPESPRQVAGFTHEQVKVSLK